MKYVNTETETVMTFEELRLANPNVSFPVGGPTDAWLSDNGYQVLVVPDEPEVQPNEVLEDKGIEEVNGVYQTKWEVRPKTAEETQETKDRITEALAEHRYNIENGGIDVNGVLVQTDRISRADLIGARTLAKEDANYSVEWKTRDGFVTLTSAQIIAVADAVAAFVQQCFVAEKTTLENIDSFGFESDAFEFFAQQLGGS